jgi:hypothetical protein
LSGDLEELLVGDGLKADSLFPGMPRAVGASTFTIREARSLGVTVHHEPVLSDWYHGAARGRVAQAKKRLHKLAVVLVPIDEAAALNWFMEKHGRTPWDSP